MTNTYNLPPPRGGTGHNEIEPITERLDTTQQLLIEKTTEAAYWKELVRQLWEAYQQLEAQAAALQDATHARWRR